MELKDSLTSDSQKLLDTIVAAGVEIELKEDPAVETWYVQTNYRFKIGSPGGKPNKPA